ncbi:MAG: zinc ABC transporter substrate-binding protein [Opitutaceae bacterium]|nr:zinc ABC transporter substrate-binding protein [Cytophagales bacterium]
MHLLFYRIFLTLSLSFLFYSCQNTEKKERFYVVTTTGHIADLVRNVAGNKATVAPLMGAGVDPHLYKASLSDLKLLQSADIIFYNGLHLEGKMGEVFHKLSRTKKVFAVSDGIPRDSLLMVDEENHIPDPHIWFDVEVWQYCLDKVCKEMILADPENKEYYLANAAKYRKELNDLNILIKDKFQIIPRHERLLVTAHDAFGYFGRRYDVEVIGLQGISTLSEYGLNEITTLSRMLISRKVKAVFIETSVSEKAIQSVIEGCKQQGHLVKIGGSLYSDALGAANTPEGTYIGMQKANLKLITEGLK